MAYRIVRFNYFFGFFILECLGFNLMKVVVDPWDVYIFNYS